MRWFPFVLLALLFLVGGCGITHTVIDKEKYDKVQNGMSYAQVQSIIGSAGSESASTHMDGVPGVMPDITDKIYTWQNPDGSNMNATFQNDQLVGKAQAGL